MSASPRPVLAVAGAVVALALLPLWVRHLVPSPEPHDFYVDWMAARDVLAGRPLYRPLAEEAAALGGRGEFIARYATHPPTAALAALPVAWLDYPRAFLVWNLASLAVLAVALRMIARELGWAPGPGATLIGVAALMAWTPLWELVEHGQSGAYVLALVVVGWRALRRDADGAAGGAFGAATALKVYPGLLVAWLLLARRWRAAGAAAATMLALAALVTLMTGPSAWSGYVAHGLPELRRWWPNWMNASVTGFVARLCLPDARTVGLLSSPALAAALVAGGTALVLGVAAATCARDRGDVDRGVALVTTAALLVSPVAWPHYFVVLLLPLAVVLATPPRPGRRALLGLAVAWVLMDVPASKLAFRLIGDGPASARFSLAVLSANFYGLAGFFAWQVTSWRRSRPPDAP